MSLAADTVVGRVPGLRHVSVGRKVARDPITGETSVADREPDRAQDADVLDIVQDRPSRAVHREDMDVSLVMKNCPLRLDLIIWMTVNHSATPSLLVETIADMTTIDTTMINNVAAMTKIVTKVAESHAQDLAKEIADMTAEWAAITDHDLVQGIDEVAEVLTTLDHHQIEVITAAVAIMNKADTLVIGLPMIVHDLAVTHIRIRNHLVGIDHHTVQKNASKMIAVRMLMKSDKNGVTLGRH